MGILELIFPRKKQDQKHELSHPTLEDLLVYHDYLGPAANKKHEALKLIKEKQYDEAWRSLHEGKMFLIQHANQYSLSAIQAIALDGSVHEHLANILRLEGRNDDALIHCAYWIKSSAPQGITKKQINKLPAYLNRSSVHKDLHKEVIDYVTCSSNELASFSLVKAALSNLFNTKG